VKVQWQTKTRAQLPVLKHGRLLDHANRNLPGFALAMVQTTGNQIDQLTYELYNLTQQEIKTIEDAAAP